MNDSLLEARCLVAKALGCDVNDISGDSSLKFDTKWDSFGQLSVMLELEKSYGVEINDTTIERYSSVPSIQSLIASSE